MPAILDIWYPGTQGGAAVANLLFGDVSPGGKLPFTWPRTVGQVPMIYAHTRSHEPENQARRYWHEASTPLYPFGFGLSYGRFDYSDLTVDEPTTMTGGTSTVSVNVTNPADLHQRHGSAARPIRELKGFQRVTLAAGESRRLSFSVGPNERRYWNAALRDWIVEPATFDVWVAGDSTAQLSTVIEVTGDEG